MVVYSISRISKDDSQSVNIKSLSSSAYHNTHVNEELLETEKTNSVDLTYAAVDKKREKKQTGKPKQQST